MSVSLKWLLISSICIVAIQLILLTWNRNSTVYEVKYGRCPLSETDYVDLDISTRTSDYMDLWNMRNDLKNFYFQIKSLAKPLFLLSIFQESADAINDGYEFLNHRIEAAMSTSQSVRGREIYNLRKIIREKIYQLQHPEDCNKARILVCHVKCTCGFGCWVHLVVNCLMIAFREQRTLVYKEERWKYAEEGAEYAFLPLTNCSQNKHLLDEGGLRRVKHINLTNHLPKHKTNWIPWSIPLELAPFLTNNHGSPFAWWISQFSAYILRYQPWLKQYVEEQSKLINFEHPIAGIQIRRGDKLLSEANRFEVSDYMQYVERWFNQLELKNKHVKRRVFVATEDSTVLPELKIKYPRYTFLHGNIAQQTDLSRNNFSFTEIKGMRKLRYNEEGLLGIVIDLHMLSRCDFLACTATSNVCKTAYEIMTYLRADGSTRFQSVDKMYGWRKVMNGTWRAITYHRRQNRSTLVGDELKINYDLEMKTNEGYLRGKNQRTRKEEIVPAYKLREQLMQVSYPILSDLAHKYTSGLSVED